MRELQGVIYSTLIGWVKHLGTWPKLRNLVPGYLRRPAFDFLVRHKRGPALAGRVANMDDIEALILANPIRLKLPLILISQAQRSGGTLLSQLFDGHPDIAAHPQELKIGYPHQEDWPPLDPALGAFRNFHMLYEAKTIFLMKNGYAKGEHDSERRRFFLVPRVQYRLFEHLFEIAPPSNRRDILDHFFTAYFNAWLNYQGTLERKRWVTAFAPRLALCEASVAGFFNSYPDGRLVQVVRDPRTWYPSAKNHAKSANKSMEDTLSIWCLSAESILRNKASYGGGVIVLRFEDLVANTDCVMRSLAGELGIAYEPILAQPTFNGGVMRANSSFALEDSGVIKAPLTRGDTLTGEERKLIESRCLGLYHSTMTAVTQIAT
jgi:hypothetical protein